MGLPFVTWFGAMMPSVVACHLESYPEQKLDGKGSSRLLQLPSGCRHSRVVKFPVHHLVPKRKEVVYVHPRRRLGGAGSSMLSVPW